MKYESIIEAIKHYAGTQPDALAVCEMNKSVTYAQYWDGIAKTAAALVDAGLQKGDHVLLRNFQNIDYLTAFSALQYMGALPIPIEKSINEERMAEIAEKARASVVISNSPVPGLSFISLSGLAEKKDEFPPMKLPMPRSDERSMMLYTTGTTGASKGIIMHHLGDVSISENIIQGTEMKKGNVEIIPMPLNHSFALRRYQSDMVNGGTACLMNGIAFIGVLWKMIAKYGATSMAIAPAALSVIFKLSDDKIAEYDGQFDYIQVGSAPLPEADKQRLLRLLPHTRLYNFYGSTEAGCACILNFNSGDDRSGCIGRPTVNSKIRFTDENGREMPHTDKEHPGLLSWGGPIVMECYYKDPAETARTLQNGYIRTNDMAWLDEEGRCILIGRADDIINSGGNKIAPSEIEKIADSFPGVCESVCSSVKDSLLGEAPVLVVVPKKDGYDKAGLLRFLSERIEGYKLPRALVEAESLPRTFNGKILRRQAKETLAEKGVKPGDGIGAE
ncbi:MAG: long-chain fatty acid--CoA ligase [Clostridiales bacterium]|nr:MAG: long-chain fatty acid--CoA ligase [Clostridiales bacterium]